MIQNSKDCEIRRDVECPRVPSSPHIAALILARGGSQGITLKNLVPLGGRPLLCWALESVQQFGKFDSVWVSTDHSGIAECALACGAKVFDRQAQYALDTSSSISSVQEFVNVHKEVDVVGLIQCTSPFLQPDFLESAYKLIFQGYDSIFSVTREKKLRWTEANLEKGESAKPINFSPRNRPRRQDWKGELVENGMFYFARRWLVEEGLLQGGRCGTVEIPQQFALEIDTPLDLTVAQQIATQDHVKIGKNNRQLSGD